MVSWRACERAPVGARLGVGVGFGVVLGLGLGAGLGLRLGLGLGLGLPVQGAPATAERGPRRRGNSCPGRRGRRGVAAGVPIEAAWLGFGLGLNYLAQALYLAQAVARTLTPTLDPNPSPSATVVELTTRVRAKGDVRVHGGHRVRHEEDEAVGRAVQKARVAAPACRAHL